MADFVEYPKALYASVDQAGPYLVAKDRDEEEQLRAGGLKMLGEWIEAARDAEAKAKAAKVAKVTKAV